MLTVGTGTLYVGGQRLDLDAAVQLDGSPQPEWLDQSTDSLWVAPAPVEASPPQASPPQASPPTSPPSATNELVYLLAVEQEVSALEDPTLADVALGGPDTMQRVRIVQRFVRWSTASSDCADAWEEVQAAWKTIGLNLDTGTMQLESTARLQVSFDQVAPSTGPCQPTASGGFLGPENQLIRVQVNSVDPETGAPTVVWGFDDASFLYQLESAVPNGTSGMVFTLAQSPVDQYHYPQAGQSVELLRDVAGLPLPGEEGQAQSTSTAYIASASGFVSAVTSTYNPSQMSLAVSGQPPNDYLSISATPQLYLRVWQDSVTAPNGTTVDLEGAGAVTGLSVTLTSSEGFHPGDFWRFAVRPSVAQLVYPAQVATSPQAPDGARVWACPVAFVSWPSAGNPTVTSCVPAFKDLVTLTARKGGCCTLNVSPADIEGGTTLQSLLAPFAGQGPIRVCFDPGTYTLSGPLILGTEYDDISLEGCCPGVVIQAPENPGVQFVLGLVVIEGASAVSVRGIQFELPLVPFQPAEGSFAALTTEGVSSANQALLEQFSQVMNVAIGISAQGSPNLVVEDCTFDVNPTTTASLFSAGIYASGSMEGLSITGCTFNNESAPASVPFYDLVAGNQPPTPYQVTFGYLQVSITGTVDETTTLGQLHNAAIENCLFQGLTVAAMAVAQLGTLRVENDTVQDCYGGFWLVSLGAAALGLTFDLLPIGDNQTRADFVNLNMTGLADGVFLIASAIARVLPSVPPLGLIIFPRIIAVPDPVLLSNAALSLQTFLGQTVALPEGSPPSSGAAPSPAPAGSPPSSGPTSATGTSTYGTDAGDAWRRVCRRLTGANHGRSCRRRSDRTRVKRDRTNRFGRSRTKGGGRGARRTGGVRTGRVRGRGARDRGARDRGARDRGARDRGARDRGARDRGARDRGARDRGARDRGVGHAHRFRVARDHRARNLRSEHNSEKRRFRGVVHILVCPRVGDDQAHRDPDTHRTGDGDDTAKYGAGTSGDPGHHYRRTHLSDHWRDTSALAASRAIS